MLKLSNKSGFTIVEVLCSISIISVLLLCITTLQLNNLRLKNYNKEKLDYITVVDALKEEIINNSTYNDVLSLSNLNKKFVNKEKLNISCLRDLSLEQLCDEYCDYSNTFIRINISPGELLRIELELHIKLKLHEEIIKCEFYKGDYL
jgi:prepilin-type N-terminal cleavage/methylation domain-containing protein